MQTIGREMYKMAYVKINKDRCKSCGLCIKNCKQGLLVVLEGELNALGYHPVGFVDEEGECKGCKICGEMCPDCAIEVYK